MKILDNKIFTNTEGIYKKLHRHAALIRSYILSADQKFKHINKYENKLGRKESKMDLKRKHIYEK